MKKELIKAFKFFGISGIGWIIDMTIYTLLSTTNIPIILINVISSFCAVTFIFIFSTKKIFKENKTKFSKKQKYIIYLIYQIIIVSSCSFLIDKTNDILLSININIITNYSKILAKIIITPISMILNYLFMRFLIEKK